MNSPDGARIRRSVERLRLVNVGPAPEMAMELASRFNIVTGDNGLGKSFLLDVIWWVLTRTWPQQVNSGMGAGYMAEPRDPTGAASITAWVREPARGSAFEVTYTFAPPEETWVPGPSRGTLEVQPDQAFEPYQVDFMKPFATSLVVYAHADGSFSSWDPLRHGSPRSDDRPKRRPALVLTPDEVYNGASVEERGKKVHLCNGLIRDWVNWSAARDRDHERMMAVLNAVAADAFLGPLELGEPTRLSLTDSRDIPTILTRYAGPVPILHASAGVRRVASLAYMLALTWREHRVAARRLGRDTCEGIVLLVDEIESHLHPRWQRLILHSLQAAVETTPDPDLRLDTQVIVTTHSPLVMSSAEGFFDETRDRWFDLAFAEGPDSDGLAHFVELRSPPFERLGTVGHWLEREDAFGLPTDRGNTRAEALILKARKLLDGGAAAPELEDVESLSDDLAEELEVNDPFLARWGYFVEDVKRRKRT